MSDAVVGFSGGATMVGRCSVQQEELDQAGTHRSSRARTTNTCPYKKEFIKKKEVIEIFATSRPRMKTPRRCAVNVPGVLLGVVSGAAQCSSPCEKGKARYAAERDSQPRTDRARVNYLDYQNIGLII
ncbi:hypothetical protein ACJJTC_009617 [Scirpophaga incertulas]